jgi:hypothetical protein
VVGGRGGRTATLRGLRRQAKALVARGDCRRDDSINACGLGFGFDSLWSCCSLLR